jgi:2'-5' RNA ligase
MRYLVAYLIGGEAGAYHEELTKTLSERFGVKPLHEHIPPHLTCKAPFETDNPEGVKQALHEFSREHSACPLELCGFGGFQDTKVVYVGVEENPRVQTVVRDLRSHLRPVGLPFEEYEKNVHFYASVARFLTPEQYEDIWEHVQALPEPRFTLAFDHIALLANDGNRWVVDTIYPFPSSKTA